MIWYPYTPQKGSKTPLLIKRAKKEFLYDEDDNEYIDAVSSWWISIHGHNHPEIIKSVKEEIEKLDQVLLAGFTNTKAIELAEKLIDFTENNFHTVFYSDNGSCAVEIAIKIAYQSFINKNIKKNIIIKFSESYHGDTIGAMSVGGNSKFNLPFKDLFFPAKEFLSPDCYNCPVGKKKERCKEECLEILENYINNNHSDIFAIIMEPLIQGANGMKIYKNDILKKIDFLCKKYDIVFILDEVFTGFGRTGSKFAFMEAGVKPDIIALAKGLSGGVLPLAATLINKKIYDNFYSERIEDTFFHGHTMTGNPSACSAALASIDIFEKENRIEDIKILEFYLKKYIKNLLEKYPNLIFSPRVLGGVCAFELSEIINPQDFKNLLQEKKIIIRPLGSTIYIAPPYIISSESLSKIFHTMDIVLGGFTLS
jgi:adenosylmethionine-8-amino-7-oxononanoate aminotransferase